MRTPSPDNQNHRKEIIAIMQGLLASGHYTFVESVPDDVPAPRVRLEMHDRDWYESGYPGPSSARVVTDAIFIWGMLDRDLRFEAGEEE